MGLEEELLAELKALRAGTGLTEPRLREQPLLNLHIAGETHGERLKKLVELTDRIFDREQRFAVRYAFSIEGGHHRQVKDRRAEALKLLPMSERTLDRRENDGCRDLARFIIESSPQLSEAERQHEINHATSIAKRLADLEFLVLYMARRNELVGTDPYLEPERRKFLRPSWYRKMKQRHSAAQNAHFRDGGEYNAKFYALLERMSDEDAMKAWNARFTGDQYAPTNRWEQFLDNLQS